MLSWAQDDNVASPEQIQCIYTRTREGDADDAPTSGDSLTLGEKVVARNVHECNTDCGTTSFLLSFTQRTSQTPIIRLSNKIAEQTQKGCVS